MKIEIVKWDGLSEFTDDEVDYAFRAAKALGARALSTEISAAGARRLAPAAGRHQLMVGLHGDEATDAADFEAAFRVGEFIGANLDIGDWVAGNQRSPLPFLREHARRITHIHVKDRKVERWSEHAVWRRRRAHQADPASHARQPVAISGDRGARAPDPDGIGSDDGGGAGPRLLPRLPARLVAWLPVSRGRGSARRQRRRWRAVRHAKQVLSVPTGRRGCQSYASRDRTSRARRHSANVGVPKRTRPLLALVWLHCPKKHATRYLRARRSLYLSVVHDGIRRGFGPPNTVADLNQFLSQPPAAIAGHLVSGGPSRFSPPGRGHSSRECLRCTSSA